MYNSQLKTLVCVADCGSFTRAAERLFISPNAVMKQVNALEEHLGLVLLERSRRGVRLTAAGRSICEDAQRLFDFSREAVARARRRAADGKPAFRVGASLLNPCAVFMDLWREVGDAFPQYAVRIIPFEDTRGGILAEIGALGDKFDFLVGACDSGAWLRRCRFYPLGSYRICCAVPRGHRLARTKKLRLEDLYGECLMMGARGDSAAVDRVRDVLERQPRISIEDTSRFYDIDVFNACPPDRILLSLECWKDVHPALVTIPVDWDFSVPYGILYPLEAGAHVRYFLEVLEQRRHRRDRDDAKRRPGSGDRPRARDIPA